MADATPPPSSSSKKRKRKDTHPETKQPHILQQSTFRRTTWSYFHLILVTPGTASLPPTSTFTSTSPSNPPSSSSTTTTPPSPSLSLSPLLTSTLLTTPLRTYLGTTGAAIPIDMLKIDGREIWVRIPRGDARAFRASLAGWVGSCGGEEIPGLQHAEGGGRGGGGGGGSGNGKGRVGVAWRVVREGGVLGGGGEGDGGELFG